LAAKLPEVRLPLVDVLRKTETVLLPKLATARSDLPSPSKSPMATELGAEPVEKSILFSKSADTMPAFAGLYVGLKLLRLAQARTVPVFSSVIGA
jgi:hypothetical protein